MIGCSQTKSRVPMDALICPSIQYALQIDDFDKASQMAHRMVLAIEQSYPEVLALRLTPVSDGDVHQVALVSCSAVRALLFGDDQTRVAKAYQSAVNLRGKLEQLEASLPTSPQAKFARMEAAFSRSGGDVLRSYHLIDLAKAAVDAGELEKATAFGKELLDTAARSPADRSIGDAIYFGNWILGRVALREPPGRFHHFVDLVVGQTSQPGNPGRAGKYLIRAASVQGSPVLSSFGPNTLLAKELLERGQSKVVLRYFVLCGKFWKRDRGKLAEWTVAVKRGEIPKFGGNLTI
jgi:hypothetical protein